MTQAKCPDTLRPPLTPRGPRDTIIGKHAHLRVGDDLTPFDVTPRDHRTTDAASIGGFDDTTALVTKWHFWSELQPPTELIQEVVGQ